MKWRGLLLATYFGFAFFLLALPASVFATELKYDYYGIVTQTLTKDKSPYIVRACAQTTVKGWSTLTIEAGTVLKFEQAKTCSGSSFETRMLVDGGLIINGTETDPVVFTSIYDDSVGGDTDGDSGVTQPRMADYKFTEINSNNNNLVKIDHAIIKYAEIGLYIGSGVNQISIDRSEFAYNGTGIVTYSSNSVNASKFYGNHYAASAYDWTLFTRPQLTAINNWWGDDSGPTDTRNPGGKGQRIMGNVIYDPWMRMTVNNAPVLSFSTDTPDGVVSKTTFLPGQPVFRVVYSDADGDAPVYLKVVTNSSTFDFVTSTGSAFVSGTVYSFTPPTGTLQKGIHSFHFEASDGKVTTRFPVITELSVEVKHVPVILIPGIAGTELKIGDDHLWLNLDRMFLDFGDNFLDTLEMNNDGTSKSDVKIIDVIRTKEFLPRLTFKYFGDLINDLTKQRYEEYEDLFVFPYDWRLDNRFNSKLLMNKIDEVASSSGKVDLVVHSMGGLLAKQYMLENGSGKINKLIFLGTPHLGAPMAFKTLIAGDNFDIPFLDQIEIKKLAKNMGSVYQLLPSRKYVDQFGGYFKNSNSFGFYDYLETKSYLNGQRLNDKLLSDAEEFHTDLLDSFGLSEQTDAYNIVGCNLATLGQVVLRNTFEKDGSVHKDYDLKEVVGDGTVPLSSAIAVQVLNENRFYVKNAKHSQMPSSDGPRQLVVQILTNDLSRSALPNNVRMDPSDCFLKGKLLSVHSPVDLHAYDASGNHVGPNGEGNVDENIPGSKYYDFEGDKFVYLPNIDEQNYSVNIKATASGTFSFRIADIESDAVSKSVYFRDIPINASSAAKMTISQTSQNDSLEFDRNGTGEYLPISADSILNGSETEDYTAPSTTISLNGLNGKNGWFLSDVKVSLSANDDNSGILITKYSTDEGESWLAYSGPFIIQKDGANVIKYKSEDRAGNKENERTETIYIDRVPPEIEFAFDTSLRTLSFGGIDSWSAVTLQKTKDEIILTDEAGNITEINYSQKNSKKEIRFHLNSIIYNGKKINIPKNELSVEWEWKFDKIKELDQIFVLKHNYNIEIRYDAKRDISRIKERMFRYNKDNKLNGMKVLKIETKNGLIKYSY